MHRSDHVSMAILGTRGIPARYGGFETFADEISIRLVEHDVAVTVYCEMNPELEQLGTYKGVKLEYVPVSRLGPLTTILFDLKCLWRARRDFDVVYMLGYGSSLFCFLPRLHRREVWINMDGLEWARSKWSWPARVWLKWMERIAMWTPSRIVADAEAIRANLSARYRHMPDCEVIPYGATLVERAPSVALLTAWEIESGAYFLMVCRLEPENHVLEILQGFAASQTSLPLIILGDHRAGTPYVSQLLEVKDARIRFVGTVFDQEKLRALRYHCRAYFHGHSVGGTNPSLLEALGCGNAVIAHDNPFNREVAGNIARYFREAGDIPALVQSFDNADESRADIRQAACAIIKENYTWEKITAKYLALLQRSGKSGTQGCVSDTDG